MAATKKAPAKRRKATTVARVNAVLAAAKKRAAAEAARKKKAAEAARKKKAAAAEAAAKKRKAQISRARKAATKALSPRKTKKKAASGTPRARRPRKNNPNYDRTVGAVTLKLGPRGGRPRKKKAATLALVAG